MRRCSLFIPCVLFVVTSFACATTEVSDEEALCERAADHLASCTSMAGEAPNSSCDRDAAEAVLASDCDELSSDTADLGDDLYCLFFACPCRLETPTSYDLSHDDIVALARCRFGDDIDVLDTWDLHEGYSPPVGVAVALIDAQGRRVIAFWSNRGEYAGTGEPEDNPFRAHD